MPKKNESVLGLAPLSPTPNFSANGSLIPSIPIPATRRDLQWIADDLAEHAALMEAMRTKSVVGQTHIAHVHQHGVKTFDEAVGAIMELKSAQRSPEHQAYTDEFCSRSAQLLGRHLLGTIEVAATNIAELVDESITEPWGLPPPPKPGFFQRLLGG